MVDLILNKNDRPEIFLEGEMETEAVGRCGFQERYCLNPDTVRNMRK
jgi:hypothetical protein